MPLLKLDLPWDSQPQEAVGVANAFNLTALVLPGQSNFDLVTGAQLSSSSGTVSRGIGSQGRQLTLSSNQASIYTTATTAQRSPTESSLVWVGVLNGTPSADACLGGITFDGANASPYVYAELKRSSDIDNNIYLTFSDSGAYPKIVSSASYAFGFVVIVATIRPGRQKLFIRSASSTEVLSGTSAAAMRSSATSRLEIGDSLNARNPNASCAMFAMASRAWSDGEANELLWAPWQLFEPRRIYIPTAAAPSGIPTLSAATFVPGSITATGFRPRVTVTF